MEVLAARVLLRPVDMAVSLAFYRDVLGLAIAREFPGGTVFSSAAGSSSGPAPRKNTVGRRPARAPAAPCASAAAVRASFPAPRANR